MLLKAITASTMVNRKMSTDPTEGRELLPDRARSIATATTSTVTTLAATVPVKVTTKSLISACEKLPTNELSRSSLVSFRAVDVMFGAYGSALLTVEALAGYADGPHHPWEEPHRDEASADEPYLPPGPLCRISFAL